MVIEKKLSFSAFKLYLYIKGRAYGQISLENLKSHYEYDTKYFIKPNHNKVYGEFRKVELPEKHIICNRHIDRMLKELRDNHLVAKENGDILSCYEPGFFVALQKTKSNTKRRYRPYYYKTSFAGAKTGNNFILLENDVSLLDSLIQLVSNIISRSQFFRNSTHQLSVLKPFCNYICSGKNKKTLILKDDVSLDGLPNHVGKFIERLSASIFDRFCHPPFIRQSDVDNLPVIFDSDWKYWDDDMVDVFLQHTEQNIFRSKYFKNSYHNLSVLKPYIYYLFRKYVKDHSSSEEKEEMFQHWLEQYAVMYNLSEKQREILDYAMLDLWDVSDVIMVDGKPFEIDEEEYEMEKWLRRNDPLPRNEELDNFERQLLMEIGYNTIMKDKTPTLTTVNKDPSPNPEIDDFERRVLSEMDTDPMEEEKSVPDIFKNYNLWKSHEIQDCEFKYDPEELKTKFNQVKYKYNPLREYENSEMESDKENLSILFGS